MSMNTCNMKFYKYAKHFYDVIRQYTFSLNFDI